MSPLRRLAQRLCWLAGSTLALAALATPTTPEPAASAPAVADFTSAAAYSFAVFGDIPYDQQEREELPEMLRQIGADAVAFGAHLGDFKSGTMRCDDALYQDRLTLFGEAPFPMVYVPGEHDWADCMHASAGAYQPQERLNRLRQLFFAKPQTLGPQPFALEQQANTNYSFGAFQEHLRWVRGPALFVSLNLPGNDNAIGRVHQPNPEYLVRMAAVRDWLETSFALARQRKLRGIVLLAHANPDFYAWSSGVESRGYGEFLRALQEEVDHYDGEVLFIHGDTHVMRNDRPLLNADGTVLQRFREVEVYGSPITGWVFITVDINDNNLFRIRARPFKQD